MNLEPIIQNESQKEKNKHCVSTYKYGIQKNGTYETTFRATMETQRTDSWTQAVGGGRWGGMHGDSNTEIDTLSYVKQPTGICCMTLGTQTRAL